MDGASGVRAPQGRTRPRCRRGSRRRAAAEEGATLVEVLIAFAVLMVVMAAVATTLTQALEITHETRVREVGANTAAAEAEVLRRIDPADVPVGTQRYEVETSVGTATVERTAEWVPSDAVGDACESPAGQSRDLLRVTIEVHWPLRGIDPTVTQTVLTPDVGTFDVGLGHVSVQVTDAAGEVPTTRPLVRLSGGPDGVQRTAMVSADGCVLFDHLEPGDYEVRVEAPGIGPQGADPVAPATVQAAATTQVTLPFAEASELQVTFVASPHAAVRDDWLDVALRNTALLPDPRQDVDGVGLVRTLPSLFPFPSGYEVWAGIAGCDAVDPQAVELARTVAVMQPGGTTTVEVPLTTVRIRPVTPSGNPVPGVQVDAVLASDEGCPGGARAELGRAGGDGALLVALPPGRWSFDLSGGGLELADVVVADTPIDLEVRVDGR